MIFSSSSINVLSYLIFEILISSLNSTPATSFASEISDASWSLRFSSDFFDSTVPMLTSPIDNTKHFLFNLTAMNIADNIEKNVLYLAPGNAILHQIKGKL